VHREADDRKSRKSKAERDVCGMAGPARFERATLCLEGRCSIQLSYGPVRLFYQRNRNPSPNYATSSLRGEAKAYTSTWIVMSGKFSPKNPLPHCVRCSHANTSGRLCFHLSNARQSKTFCDIVLVIDAYRSVQLLTRKMRCIHAGRLSSRERRISETCILR
jgi:hypothetical protein